MKKHAWALTRLIERNRAELAALHPEAGAILEKLEGNQAELRDYEARLALAHDKLV